MLSALEISATGLEARRLWMNTIAENIANAETTRDADGNAAPYRRREPVFVPHQVGNATGVAVLDIIQDPSPFRVVNDPGHPDADADGNVQFPNINVIQEMVDIRELFPTRRRSPANVGSTLVPARKLVSLGA